MDGVFNYYGAMNYLLAKEQERMFWNAGFAPDRLNGLYFNETGAFMTNISKDSVDDIICDFSKFLKKGYIIAVGRPAPANNGVIYNDVVGVYVENFEDIISKEKLASSTNF